MACFVNVLLAYVFICIFVKDVAAQGADVKSMENAEQFALLCRIYNVAKNPPINHVDLQDPDKIVNEIDAHNASFKDPNLFNETEKMENISNAQVKPTTTREKAVGKAIMRRITHKAHTILDEIKKVNATRDIEKVKAEFSKVIFGEGMNESYLCEGALNGVGERGNACGGSGADAKGASAGKNLVVDFFCLCAMRTDKDKEGIKEVCGVEVGGKDEKLNKHGWGNAVPSGSSSMWASIKKGCGKHLHQHPKSTQEVHEVIDDFLTHLKDGGLFRWGDSSNKVKGSDRKPGMLGTGAGSTENGGSDFLCNGSRGYGRSIKPPGGICVYYGTQSEWDSIDWLKKLKTALDSLATLHNQTATIQRSIQKLQMLLHRAEEIYETTKLISEIQDSVVPTNLQTAAKRLTAYSSAWRYHHHTRLILLWVL